MAIQVTCSNCFTSHSINDSFAGKKAKCKCGGVISIPSLTTNIKKQAPTSDVPSSASAAPKKFKFVCPNCSNANVVDSELAGKKVRCACGYVVQLPAPKSPASSSTPTSQQQTRPVAARPASPASSPLLGTGDLFAGSPSAPTRSSDPFAGMLPPPSAAVANPFASLSSQDWASAGSPAASPVNYGSPLNNGTPVTKEGRKKSDAEALNAYQASSSTYSRLSDDRIDHGKEIPVILILIAILDFAWAGLLGLCIIVLVLAAGFLSQILPVGGTIGLAVIGLYLMADAAAYVVSGAMLFTRKTWGWYVAVGTHTLGFCIGFTDLISYMIFNGMSLPKFFGLGISGYAFWVLSVLYSDEVRDRFRMRSDPTKILLIFGVIMLSVGFAVNLPLNYFVSANDDDSFNWGDEAGQEFDPGMDEGDEGDFDSDISPAPGFNPRGMDGGVNGGNINFGDGVE